MNSLRTRRSQTERGAALIVALVFLVALTLLGVSSMRTTTLQQRMAGNTRDSNLAFQAAESGLREAERFLEQSTLRAFSGNSGLLQRQYDAGAASFWTTYDWDNASFTAAALPGIAEPPRYVIEALPPVPGDGDSLRFGALPDSEFYRVTSRAVGGTTDTVRILQSTYRR